MEVKNGFDSKLIIPDIGQALKTSDFCNYVVMYSQCPCNTCKIIKSRKRYQSIIATYIIDR